MIFVFYFLAAVQIYFSYRSFRGGVDYLRFFRTELSKPVSSFAPFVSVIAPCRGVDGGMKENLLSLFNQDYPQYEIIFVVDDRSDGAYAVIEDLIHHAGAGTQEIETLNTSSLSPSLRGKNSVSASLVVAPEALASSQKVENLREAVLHADVRSKAFVFVDSDARPSNGWLRGLAAPLENDEVGAATGYRWHLPAKNNFASELNSTWNASAASALGANTANNFCWGGSMAIRRDVFDRLDIRGKWAGTLSDDYTVTRIMNKVGLPIVFVPQAMCISAESHTLAGMLEFTTRQMKITRVYSPRLWIISLIGSSLFNFVMLAAVLIAIFSKQYDIAFAVAIFTLVSVVAFSAGKSYLRLKAVREALPQHDKALARQTLFQMTLFLPAQPLFLFNCLAAAVSRRLTWRGTTYELKSPNETVIISGG